MVVKRGYNIIFPYIPGHLHYIITEILKNAVVSHHANKVLDKPINVIMAEGKKDVIIKISDFGSGFPISQIEKMFTYAYSTQKLDILPEYEVSNTPIMAGFGFGLPTARLYAQYFGGELYINPLENYGTDVFIYINKLGDTSERLY